MLSPLGCCISKLREKAKLSGPLEQVARITHSFHLSCLEASEGHEVAQLASPSIGNTLRSKKSPRDILHISGMYKMDISHLAKAKSVFFVSNRSTLSRRKRIDSLLDARKVRSLRLPLVLSPMAAQVSSFPIPW